MPRAAAISLDPVIDESVRLRSDKRSLIQDAAIKVFAVHGYPPELHGGTERGSPERWSVALHLHGTHWLYARYDRAIEIDSGVTSSKTASN